MYSRIRVGRTLEYATTKDVAYCRVRPPRVWRTLEYATTKEECTLESKSCLESVAVPTPVRHGGVMLTKQIGYHDNSSTDISSTTLRLQTFCLQIFCLL